MPRMYRAQVPIATPVSTLRRSVRDRIQYANCYRQAPREKPIKGDPNPGVDRLYHRLCWLNYALPSLLCAWLCGELHVFLGVLIFGAFSAFAWIGVLFGR